MKKKNRIFSAVATLAMAASMLGVTTVSAFATDGTIVEENKDYVTSQRAMVHSDPQTVAYDGRTYTLTVNAYAEQGLSAFDMYFYMPEYTTITAVRETLPVDTTSAGNGTGTYVSKVNDTQLHVTYSSATTTVYGDTALFEVEYTVNYETTAYTAPWANIVEFVNPEGNTITNVMTSFGAIIVEGTQPQPQRMKGDMDGDNDVDLADLIRIQRSLVYDEESLTDEQWYCADINGDGQVTIADCQWVQKYLAGMIESLENIGGGNTEVPQGLTVKVQYLLNQGGTIRNIGSNSGQFAQGLYLRDIVNQMVYSNGGIGNTYKLDGVYKDKACTVSVDPEEVLNKDVTLYVVFLGEGETDENRAYVSVTFCAEMPDGTITPCFGTGTQYALGRNLHDIATKLFDSDEDAQEFYQFVDVYVDSRCTTLLDHDALLEEDCALYVKMHHVDMTGEYALLDGDTGAQMGSVKVEGNTMTLSYANGGTKVEKSGTCFFQMGRAFMTINDNEMYVVQFQRLPSSMLGGNAGNGGGYTENNGAGEVVDKVTGSLSGTENGEVIDKEMGSITGSLSGTENGEIVEVTTVMAGILVYAFDGSGLTNTEEYAAVAGDYVILDEGYEEGEILEYQCTLYANGLYKMSLGGVQIVGQYYVDGEIFTFNEMGSYNQTRRMEADNTLETLYGMGYSYMYGPEYLELMEAGWYCLENHQTGETIVGKGYEILDGGDKVTFTYNGRTYTIILSVSEGGNAQFYYEGEEANTPSEKEGAYFYLKMYSTTGEYVDDRELYVEAGMPIYEYVRSYLEANTSYAVNQIYLEESFSSVLDQKMLAENGMEMPLYIMVENNVGEREFASQLETVGTLYVDGNGNFNWTLNGMAVNGYCYVDEYKILLVSGNGVYYLARLVETDMGMTFISQVEELQSAPDNLAGEYRMNGAEGISLRVTILTQNYLVIDFGNSSCDIYNYEHAAVDGQIIVDGMQMVVDRNSMTIYAAGGEGGGEENMQPLMVEFGRFVDDSFYPLNLSVSINVSATATVYEAVNLAAMSIEGGLYSHIADWQIVYAESANSRFMDLTTQISGMASLKVYLYSEDWTGSYALVDARDKDNPVSYGKMDVSYKNRTVTFKSEDGMVLTGSYSCEGRYCGYISAWVEGVEYYMVAERDENGGIEWMLVNREYEFESVDTNAYGTLRIASNNTFFFYDRQQKKEISGTVEGFDVHAAEQRLTLMADDGNVYNVRLITTEEGYSTWEMMTGGSTEEGQTVSVTLTIESTYDTYEWMSGEAVGIHVDATVGDLTNILAERYITLEEGAFLRVYTDAQRVGEPLAADELLVAGNHYYVCAEKEHYQVNVVLIQLDDETKAYTILDTYDFYGYQNMSLHALAEWWQTKNWGLAEAYACGDSYTNLQFDNEDAYVTGHGQTVYVRCGNNGNTELTVYSAYLQNLENVTMQNYKFVVLNPLSARAFVGVQTADGVEVESGVFGWDGDKLYITVELDGITRQYGLRVTQTETGDSIACMEYVYDADNYNMINSYDYVQGNGDSSIAYTVYMYGTNMDGATGVESGSVIMRAYGEGDLQKVGSWTKENDVYYVELYQESLALQLTVEGKLTDAA